LETLANNQERWIELIFLSFCFYVRYFNKKWSPDFFVIFLFKIKSVQNNISEHIWAYFVRWTVRIAFLAMFLVNSIVFREIHLWMLICCIFALRFHFPYPQQCEISVKFSRRRLLKFDYTYKRKCTWKKIKRFPWDGKGTQ
jgi:hypothetical protein